tara:strand:+ start:4101 stop:4430 length:330 start_codon:yes stop_codon:yes gene_type:complete
MRFSLFVYLYYIFMGCLFLGLFVFFTFFKYLPLIHAFVLSVMFTAMVNIVFGTIYIISIMVSACFEQEVEDIIEMTERPSGPSGPSNIVVIQNPNHISLGIACEKKVTE